MTSRTVSIELATCALVALACQAPNVPESTLHAALVQTCAPWDGPAVALFLTDQPAVATYPEAPYLAVMVYKGVSEILGGSFEVSSTTQNLGQGQVCPAAGECYPAPAAAVTFGGLAADSTVEVTWRLELASDSVVTGRSRARLHPAQGMCG